MHPVHSRISKVRPYTRYGVAVALLALFAGANVTHAASFHKVHGTAREVPDDGYDGTLSGSTVAKSRINIDPADGGSITDLNVTIAMSHHYVGDLTIKLRSPNGTLVTLLNRAGKPGASDDGADGGGDSSNLSIDQPITYDDQAASGMPSHLMGYNASNSENVGTVAGSPSAYLSSSDLLNVGTLAALNGEELAGKWMLAIGDSSPDNHPAGQLTSWSLEATTEPAVSVPAPSAAMAGLMLLGGVIGVGALRRPRRDHA